MFNQSKKKNSLFQTALFLSLLLTGFFTQSISAQQFCSQDFCSQEFSPPLDISCYFKCTRPTLEVKAGYFFFLNSKLQKIYNKGGIDAQVSGTYPLWRGLELYTSVEYLQKCGRSLGDHQKTSIYQIPVNVGLRPVLTFNHQVKYYATLGPRYFYLNQHNDSIYVPKNRGRSGVGFFANTGFNFTPVQNFVIDIFGEYSWARTKFHDAANNVYTRNLQVGGLTFGGGLAYVF